MKYLTFSKFDLLISGANIALGIVRLSAADYTWGAILISAGILGAIFSWKNLEVKK